MKFLVAILSVLFAVQLPVSAQFTADSIQLVTSDITLFWSVYNAANGKPTAKQLQKDYLDQGSAGLKGFIPMRIVSGKYLAKRVQAYHNQYQKARPYTERIPTLADTIRRQLWAFREWYPAATYPPIYFVIGAHNSGGTTFRGGLIVGAEMFGDSSNRLGFETLDETVAHEWVHFQQRYPNDRSLLAQSIREGSADFLSELITGGKKPQGPYTYGFANEQALWKEFSSRMHESDWKDWLYGGGRTDRPADLGYWMGFVITRAYYQKATDKQKAIAEILNIRDFKAFLAASGYNGPTP